MPTTKPYPTPMTTLVEQVADAMKDPADLEQLIDQHTRWLDAQPRPHSVGEHVLNVAITALNYVRGDVDAYAVRGALLLLGEECDTQICESLDGAFLRS